MDQRGQGDGGMMKRRVILWLVVIAAFVALTQCARTVLAQDDTLYLHGAVQPPTAGVVVSITQPGGVIRETTTRADGEWAAGVRWRPGVYVLEAAGSLDVHVVSVPPGTPASGPWVFVLGEPTPMAWPTPTDTMTPTATRTATVTPTHTYTPTPTATPTMILPVITPLVMRLNSAQGDLLGEFLVELWMSEDGEVELINLSGAVWRRR